MKLYHGTSERVARLAMTEGLCPRFESGVESVWEDHPSSEHYVYLTVAYAAYFAMNAAPEGERWAIIEIDTDLLPDLAFLQQQIGGLGYEVTPSVCNFVLVHFPDEPGRSAADADRFLQQRGLVVRPLQPYGLPNALRITVGDEDANRRVVEALAAFAGT